MTANVLKNLSFIDAYIVSWVQFESHNTDIRDCNRHGNGRESSWISDEEAMVPEKVAGGMCDTVSR